MLRNPTLWLVAVLAAALVLGLALISSRQSSKLAGASARPTTYSAAPEGMRALYDLLASLGYQVQRFQRPYTELPDGYGYLLIVVEPLAHELDKEEVVALKGWLDTGNGLLLILGSPKSAVLEACGWNIGKIEESNEQPREVPGVEIDPDQELLKGYLDDVRRVWVDGRLRLILDKQYTFDPLVREGDVVHASIFRRRLGRKYIVSGSIGHRNKDLARADNAVLFVNFAKKEAGDSLVLFDEYHQGYESPPNNSKSLWGALGPTAQIFALHMLLVLGLIVYNANIRFGPPLALRPPSSRPSTEYIESMAGLFQRARATGIALEMHYAAFTRDLAKRLGLPPDADIDRLADASAASLGLPRQELHELLKTCQEALAQERPNEDEMTSLVTTLQSLRRSIDLDRF